MEMVRQNLEGKGTFAPACNPTSCAVSQGQIQIIVSCGNTQKVLCDLGCQYFSAMRFSKHHSATTRNGIRMETQTVRSFGLNLKTFSEVAWLCMVMYVSYGIYRHWPKTS